MQGRGKVLQILYAPAVRDTRFITVGEHPRHRTVVAGQMIGQGVPKPHVLAVPLLERSECMASEARCRDNAMGSVYTMHPSRPVCSLDFVVVWRRSIESSEAEEAIVEGDLRRVRGLFRHAQLPGVARRGLSKLGGNVLERYCSRTGQAVDLARQGPDSRAGRAVLVCKERSQAKFVPCKWHSTDAECLPFLWRPMEGGRRSGSVHISGIGDDREDREDGWQAHLARIGEIHSQHRGDWIDALAGVGRMGQSHLSRYMACLAKGN